MTNNLYVDIHAIQTVPPSNINRDDTGSPKTAQYGGVTRSRVSSQSWKRAMREYFVAHMNAHKLGTRTLELVNYIADKVQKLDDNINRKDAMKEVEKALKIIGISTTNSKGSEDKHKILKSLFFIGDEQAIKLAQAIVDDKADKKDKENKKYLSSILQANPSIDIALFGRMVADDPLLNEDASSEVAHAISTHAVQNEFDFFTAIDDFSQANDAGAGMLGTTEYNSSTMYRYANINGNELLKQLDNDEDKTINSIKLFIEAFVKSMPTGHVTSFANQTLPKSLVVTVRDDRPVNLVGGFENPIKSTHGYVDQSVKELTDEFSAVQKFVNKPKFTLTIGIKDILDKMKTDNNDLLTDDQDSLDDLLNNFADDMKSLLSED